MQYAATMRATFHPSFECKFFVNLKQIVVEIFINVSATATG